jgi:hypothetical protein
MEDAVYHNPPCIAMQRILYLQNEAMENWI